jgi:hypothetical protein
MNLEARVATLEETVAKQAAVIEALQRLLMPASSAPPAQPAPLAKSNKKGLLKKNGRVEAQPRSGNAPSQPVKKDLCKYGVKCGREFCQFSHSASFCATCGKHGLTWTNVSSLNELRHLSESCFEQHIVAHQGYQYSTCWAKGVCTTCTRKEGNAGVQLKKLCADLHGCRRHPLLDFNLLRSDFTDVRPGGQLRSNLEKVLEKMGKTRAYDAWVEAGKQWRLEQQRIVESEYEDWGVDS